MPVPVPFRLPNQRGKPSRGAIRCGVGGVLTALGRFCILEPMKVCPLESDEAEAFVAWLRIKRYRHSHIINEAPMTARAGGKVTPNFAYLNKLKRMGWVKGIPDYIIVGKERVVFVELKRRIKSMAKVAPEQVEWITALGAVPNIRAGVCYGFDEARSFVEQNLR